MKNIECSPSCSTPDKDELYWIIIMCYRRNRCREKFVGRKYRTVDNLILQLKPGNHFHDLRVLFCAPTGNAAYGIKGGIPFIVHLCCH